jgi:lysophospholipase L1-like esterase
MKLSGRSSRVALATTLALAATLGRTAPQDTAMDAAACSPASPPRDTPAFRRMMQSIMSPGATFQPPDLGTLPTQIDKRTGDYPGLCRYAAENSGLHHTPRVVFMGDSITENWLAGDPTMFSDEILDRGISAQTSGQMVARFYADVIALQPRVVHLMAGTNDVAGNMGPTDEQTYKNNIMTMVDLAQRHGITVILASIPPADHFWWAPSWKPASKIRELNLWLQSYTRENHITFIDYYHVLVGAGGAIDIRYSNDGVHPNAAGYSVMRKLAMPAINK